jgi:predicted DNA-binding protein with PD1-like motif
MEVAEVKLGRTFVVVFKHGSDFYGELRRFCRKNNVRQGYIPTLIGAFKDIQVKGSMSKDLDKPELERIRVEGAELMGGGTIAYDEDADEILPHVHVALGDRLKAGAGVTSCLLDATVNFTVEMVLVEIISPKMVRVENPSLFNMKLLSLIK